MRVVVTGMGVWSSLGRTLRDFEEALREGRCGRRPVKRFDVSSKAYHIREAAVLADEESLPSQIDRTRIADLSVCVARDARDSARLPSSIDPDRFGVALGTSHGGNIAFMSLVKGRMGIPPGRVDHTNLLSNGATIVAQVARDAGARGPTITISTACASGTNSVGRAAQLIRRGRADVMLAGGADLFTELSFSGFNIAGAMTRGVCRPLDEARDGMMLGDAAAMLVLESEAHAQRRGARIYGSIAGYSIANDAYHATAPEPSGVEIARVMSEALADAKIAPAGIDYINLHGTGTPANDAVELRAIRHVFGKSAARVLMSSTKSQIGHTLGAAGSIEVVATLLGIAGGWAPPTINLDTPIAEFAEWSFVRDKAQPAKIRAALSNSFGFAGNLASIVLEGAHG